MNEQTRSTVFCTNCGAEIDINAEICPECGVRPRSIYSHMPSPGLAAVFSFFCMGLGQIYNGQLIKGIIFTIIYGISIASTIILIGFITTPLLWIWGIFDAYKTAEKINKGQI